MSLVKVNFNIHVDFRHPPLHNKNKYSDDKLQKANVAQEWESILIVL